MALDVSTSSSTSFPPSGVMSAAATTAVDLVSERSSCQGSGTLVWDSSSTHYEEVHTTCCIDLFHPLEIDRRRRFPHGWHLRRAVGARLGQIHGAHQDVDDALRQERVLCDPAARGVHLVRHGLWLISREVVVVSRVTKGRVGVSHCPATIPCLDVPFHALKLHGLRQIKEKDA